MRFKGKINTTKTVPKSGERDMVFKGNIHTTFSMLLATVNNLFK